MSYAPETPTPSLPGLSGQPIFLFNRKLGRPHRAGDDDFDDGACGEEMEVRLLRFEPAGEFEWLWPSRNIERFDRSWIGQIAIDGAKYEFRHALGHRHVYGRDRVHSVTWIAGKPTVEGVEADDYPSSRALISLIRRDGKKHARTSDDLPKVYDGFLTVDHRAEVSAPYSPRSLAVKIIEDDVPAWATHAAVRAAIKEASLREHSP